MTAARVQPIGPDAQARLRALGLLEEAQRRRELVSFAEDACFAQQIAFIRDPSKRKFAFTPRRSGKSNGFGIGLLEGALRYPQRDSLYLGLVGSAAERTIYRNTIEPILKRFSIPKNYNRQTRLLTFPNGSTIQIAGMDASPLQMDRLLGGKYHVACVDECQSAQQDLEHLVNVKLGPAVSDYALSGGGEIWLGGTPGDHMGKHFWFRLTCEDSGSAPVLGWSGHRWCVEDNPYMIAEFAAECARREAVDPNYRDDPDFRAQWLGEWVTDVGTRVYKFDARRNTHPSDDARRALLAGSDRFSFVVGVDLGWEDATAISVGAYSLADPVFYGVESEKVKQESFDELGARLVAVQAKYKPIQMFCDMVGGSKQLAMQLRAKFHLPLEMADKTEKQNHVGRMNSDFLSGRIQVIADRNEALIREWSELQLDRKQLAKGVWVENEKYDNHLADAMLYAWRFSLHHRVDVPEVTVPRPPDLAALMLERRARAASPRRLDAFDRLEEQRSAAAIVTRFRGSPRDRRTFY